MTDNILVDLSMDFSVEIVNMCDVIKGKSALTNQILRSGTSIGANIHEANYAHSRADFISKLEIALKECFESEYWLELMFETGYLEEKEFKLLIGECGLIRKMLVNSCKTAKENKTKPTKC